MIKVSMKAFAGFMQKSSSSRRTFVKNLKYPKQENRIPILYYQKALSAIKAYHSKQHPVSFLENQITALYKLANSAEKKGQKTLFLNNARVLENYLELYANRKYEIISIPGQLSVFYNNVRISAKPDLYLKEKNKDKMIKLDFTMFEPDEEEASIITHLMFDAQEQMGLHISPKNIIYAHLMHGHEYTLIKPSKKMKDEIMTACKEMNEIWDAI
jgi:hypothetical protein